METTTKWARALAFDGEVNQHVVRLDTTVQNGGTDSGMGPKQLLLCSLSACSGMDVVSVLDKMKVPYSMLEIVATAEQTEEHPKVFKEIFLTYRTDAPNTYADKVIRAVELSQDKYCGIAAMLRKHCNITHKIEHVEAKQ
jgi:putative redox protein